MSASLHSETPTPLQAWFLAARPRTLPAAVAPVIVGTAVAIAERSAHLPSVIACVAVALLLQIAANFANDVFDYQHGADTAARVGPTRVTASGLIAPAAVLRATWLTLGLAAFVGLYLIWRGGWPMLILGALAIVAAVAYTGGPAPLGYLGLGDVFVFLFFGFVAVTGTAYVQTGAVTTLSALAAIPIGCLATAILVVNNVRDAETDRTAGKKTLAVRFGVRAAQSEYLFLMIVAYLVPCVLWWFGDIGGWFWLPLLSLPLAVSLVRALYHERGAALNRRLAGTARLEIVFAVLFAGAIML